MERITEAVARIREMERCFDALREKPDPAGLEALKAYYESGLWLHDYELDEQGLLPRDLKRGVLSQDGVWDLLAQMEGGAVITFEQLEKLFSFDTQRRFCVEILFSLTGSEKFGCCWMGKMWSREEQRDIYWYGLTPDGQNAFDYPVFSDMADAPVFDGRSLRQVWNRVVVEEIDGCDPAQRLRDYLDENSDAPMLGAPR